MSKPFVPGVEHRWGLLRMSTKQAWVGLTDRELFMIYQMIAKYTQGDWLIWQAGWSQWKPLKEFKPEISVHFLALPPSAPQPPGLELGKSEQ